MTEWLKVRAWKVRIPQKGIVGSNPFLSAKAKNGQNPLQNNSIFQGIFLFNLETAYTSKGYRGFESRFLRSSSGPFFSERRTVFFDCDAVRSERPARKGRAFI